MGTCFSEFPYIFDDFVLDVADEMQDHPITSTSIQAGLARLSAGNDACDGWRELVLLYTLHRDTGWTPPEQWIDEYEQAAIQATSGPCAAQWWGGPGRRKVDGEGVTNAAHRVRAMAAELRQAARSES
jgi:hypothetical protein